MTAPQASPVTTARDLPQPVRLAIVASIRLLDREAIQRRMSIEGGWIEFEEHAKVLKEYVGALPE